MFQIENNLLMNLENLNGKQNYVFHYTIYWCLINLLVHTCSTDAVSMNALTESETGVVVVDEDGKPEDRVELAMKCLPPYNAASSWNEDLASSFRYWKIRDYAHAYRSKFVTPSMVSG